MAFDTARLGTWEWDIAQDRLWWAIEYEKRFASSPTEYEGPYAEFEVMLHPDDRAGLREALQRAADEPRQTAHEFRVIDRAEGARWIIGRARTYYDEGQRPLRLAGIFMDITERRRLEERFLQVQKMEAIGQLAGGIAHDFNNILGAIMGNTALLRRELGGSPRSLVSLDEIERASQRAKALVQRILAFSRKQQIQKREIALGPLLEEAAGLLRASLPADVELTVDCMPDAPRVRADATQIHQVLLNLGTNAWHALAGEGGHIEIRLERHVVAEHEVQQDGTLHGELQPGPYARLRVRDTGHGMDEPTLSRIFEPFFTTKTSGHGTGLGLSVVMDIVRGHQGAVKVQSQPRHGTLFELYFPALELRDDLGPPRPSIPRTSRKS